MYELNFTINDLPPIMTNGSHGHWRKAAGIKKKWRQISVHACMSKKRPIEPLTKAIGIFTRHSSFEPDSDNLGSSFKSIRDGLVDAGIITDDKSKVLTSIYKWEKASPKKGFVTVNIKQVEG